jgi:hypothetical protein
MSVPVITNFNYIVQQKFISKSYIFSWDKLTPPVMTYVFFDVYLNNVKIVRTSNNYFSIDSGIGCENKCIKIKTVYENTITNTLTYSGFSPEICFTSPPDRYCNLPFNLWQNEKISDSDKKAYQSKLENLKVIKYSSKLRYARAIKNKASGSSFVATPNLRSMYYTECIPTELNYIVKIINREGNNYFKIENLNATLLPGKTYIFNQEDSSNVGHPLKFSRINGTFTGDPNSVSSGNPGFPGAYTKYTVPNNATYNNVWMFCTIHGYGMGSLYNPFVVQNNPV